MSLRRLETITDNILNMIVYVQSPSLEYHIKTKLKDRFEVHKDFIVNTDTAKGLHNAKLDSYVAPLLCNKWLIHVNADKLTKKELLANLDKNTAHGITIYWTQKYMVYRQLTDSKEVKKQSVHCPTFTFSRLSYGEIALLHEAMIPPKKRLSQELLDFVCKSYQFDVQAVCDLFTMLKSGNTVETKKDIIESVGVGGNSVANLTLRILQAKPKSEKGKKKILSNTINLLEDLSVSYNYQTIRKFMLNNIDGCIEMKQLQIMGIYKRPNKEIPDVYNTKRLSMLRRFEHIILHELSLPQLINLKICLTEYNNYDAKIALLQAISHYYASLKLTK